MPRIDPTINLGHIITATVMILGGIGVYADGRSHDRLVDQRLIVQEESLKAIADRLIVSERTMSSMAATLTAAVEVQRMIVADRAR